METNTNFETTNIFNPIIQRFQKQAERQVEKIISEYSNAISTSFEIPMDELNKVFGEITLWNVARAKKPEIPYRKVSLTKSDSDEKPDNCKWVFERPPKDGRAICGVKCRGDFCKRHLAKGTELLNAMKAEIEAVESARNSVADDEEDQDELSEEEVIEIVPIFGEPTNEEREYEKAVEKEEMKERDDEEEAVIEKIETEIVKKEGKKGKKKAQHK